MLTRHILKVYKEIENGKLVIKRSNKVSRLNSNTILVIGMIDSPHLQKWINVVQGEFPNKKILLFPSDRPRFNNTKLGNESHNSTKVFRLVSNSKLNFIIYYIFDTLFNIRWRAYFLAKVIIFYKPSIIHFHEMQHGSYIFNLIFNYRKIPNNSRKIISTWGSDLNLYSWTDVHYNKIRSCLSWADILTSERETDLIAAERLSFKGEFRAPIYITLGHNFSKPITRIKPSSRRLILIKGHQHNAGRALNALHVISQLSHELKNFEILVYSAPESVRIQVDILRNREKINVKVVRKMTHIEMYSLFQQARISISLAVSDGLPGVLVEAMECGAFPIQSENSAVNGFLIDGRSGFIVDPWDLSFIRKSLHRALTDDLLVDNASELNYKILQEKYSLNNGILKLRELYL
jgi:glycosyltransferase involved in cell wall biosynthesis